MEHIRLICRQVRSSGRLWLAPCPTHPQQAEQLGPNFGPERWDVRHAGPLGEIRIVDQIG